LKVLFIRNLLESIHIKALRILPTPDERLT
jgi:hypothetical protein